MDSAPETDAQGSAAAVADLVPIEEVARRLGLRASAIRYYEERGLVRPSARRAGPPLVLARRHPAAGHHRALAAGGADEPRGDRRDPGRPGRHPRLGADRPGADRGPARAGGTGERGPRAPRARSLPPPRLPPGPLRS